MDTLLWIIENKEIMKFLFTIAMVLICFAIVLKTHRLFKLSLHNGIRYFRNAFVFYGVAFVLRYMLGYMGYITDDFWIYYPFLIIVFNFFMVTAGFFLLYSLIWRRLERNSYSSLFNLNSLMFYGLAIIISLLDFIWYTHYFVFISQIIVFVVAGTIAFVKYMRSDKKPSFLATYTFVMMLNIILWVVNYFVAGILLWHKAGLASVYLINLIIFSLILYGVNKVTED